MNLTDTRAIAAIFAEKGWNIEERLFHNEKLRLFEAVCNFVSTFDGQDKEFIIELLRHYEIKHDYRSFAFRFSDKLEELAASHGCICIVPVTTKASKTTKSGDSLLYELRATFDTEAHKNVYFFDSPFSPDVGKRLQEHKEADGGRESLLIFVDDFIGSGTQLSTCFAECGAVLNASDKKMLTAFVVQDDTYYRLTIDSIFVFYEKLHQKAISGRGSIGRFPEADALSIYDKIEGILGVSEQYKRGYEQSEALITLKRTPDNTLPIFWYRQTKDGDKWPAPFPRS
jgi:hypothetical protein